MPAQNLSSLCAQAPVILPSLLLCDFGNLEREVRALEDAGAKALHLDVMDGHFVPNFTYGLTIVETLARLTELPLDAHLMISNPEDYAARFVRAGAAIVTFHIEASDEPGGILDQIKAEGAAAGLALNPATDLAAVEPWLDACDLVLVMSVEPGMGGQQFNPIALDKLRRLRDMADCGARLGIDGGVNEKTIAACAAAGAELFVVGSAIFGSEGYAQAIHSLRSLARSA